MIKKALLVDDNALQLQVRERILREAGFDVDVATTVAGALAILRTNPPGQAIGAIITDHIMPDQSGAEFVRQLRQVAPDVPVIVISGLAEAEEEYEGLNVTFRQKPCPPPELIALVRSALDWN